VSAADPRPMEYLGDFSATPPWASISLACYKCMVSWTGCFDANCCPRCGNADDFYERDKVLE